MQLHTLCLEVDKNQAKLDKGAVDAVKCMLHMKTTVANIQIYEKFVKAAERRFNGARSALTREISIAKRGKAKVDKNLMKNAKARAAEKNKAEEVMASVLRQWPLMAEMFDFGMMDAEGRSSFDYGCRYVDVAAMAMDPDKYTSIDIETAVHVHPQNCSAFGIDLWAKLLPNESPVKMRLGKCEAIKDLEKSGVLSDADAKIASGESVNQKKISLEQCHLTYGMFANSAIQNCVAHYNIVLEELMERHNNGGDLWVDEHWEELLYVFQPKLLTTAENYELSGVPDFLLPQLRYVTSGSRTVVGCDLCQFFEHTCTSQESDPTMYDLGKQFMTADVQTLGNPFWNTFCVTLETNEALLIPPTFFFLEMSVLQSRSINFGVMPIYMLQHLDKDAADVIETLCVGQGPGMERILERIHLGTEITQALQVMFPIQSDGENAAEDSDKTPAKVTTEASKQVVLKLSQNLDKSALAVVPFSTGIKKPIQQQQQIVPSGGDDAPMLFQLRHDYIYL
eukprot:2495721-Karenia_brevis.AAC.1